MSDSFEEAQRQLADLGYLAMCGDPMAALALQRLGEAQDQFMKTFAERLFTDGMASYIGELLTSD